MKPLLVPLVLLCASTALGVQPTPIAFDLAVDADSFRITNVSPSAHLFQLQVRPAIEVTPPAEVGIVGSHPEDMSFSNQGRPGDDFTGWYISRLYPERWVEVTGPFAPNSDLRVEFAEPFTQSRGWIYAPLETGRFEGMTVPEPGAVVLMIVGVACVVAWKRMR